MSKVSLLSVAFGGTIFSLVICVTFTEPCVEIAEYTQSHPCNVGPKICAFVEASQHCQRS